MHRSGTNQRKQVTRATVALPLPPKMPALNRHRLSCPCTTNAPPGNANPRQCTGLKCRLPGTCHGVSSMTGQWKQYEHRWVASTPKNAAKHHLPLPAMLPSHPPPQFLFVHRTSEELRRAVRQLRRMGARKSMQMQIQHNKGQGKKRDWGGVRSKNNVRYKQRQKLA